MFDPNLVKQDFPILSEQIKGQPLVYLDNAATSQKPQAVLTAMTQYYQHDNANVHRGVHTLADRSTLAWQAARQQIATFFGATPAELILVRNATEGLNGLAYGWAELHLQPGDVIVTDLMQHHANLVPWQQVASRTGTRVLVAPVTSAGRLDLDDLVAKLSSQVKLVAISWVSNTLGTVNPIEQLVTLVRARAPHARIVLDAAQAAPHIPISFDQLDVDFMVISAHKMLGPMGVGGLFVKKELLESGEVQPWLFGGGMIEEVTAAAATFAANLVDRFSAGTPDVAAAVGWAAACAYLDRLGMDAVAGHDAQLVAYALEQLAQQPRVQLVGPVRPPQPGSSLDRLGSVAFLYQGVHAHDVAQVLDSVGVAVRSGHHCCMPLHTHFGWPATVRASFQVYNTVADIDQLVLGLAKVERMFS